MNKPVPIRDVYFHPSLLYVDIQTQINTLTEQQFDEFYGQYTKAIKDSQMNPFAPNTELDFGLHGWNRRKFFSMAKPSPGFNPDYRFVYKYDEDSTDYFKLAVGPRNAKGVEGDSIYKPAEDRIKGRNVWEKE